MSETLSKMLDKINQELVFAEIEAKELEGENENLKAQVDALQEIVENQRNELDELVRSEGLSND